MIGNKRLTVTEVRVALLDERRVRMQKFVEQTKDEFIASLSLVKQSNIKFKGVLAGPVSHLKQKN